MIAVTHPFFASFEGMDGCNKGFVTQIKLFGQIRLFPLKTNGFSVIIPNRHILALQTAAPKVREEVKE